MKILIDTSDYEEYLGPDLEEIIEEISDSELIDEVVHRGIVQDLLSEVNDDALLIELKHRKIGHTYESLFEQVIEKWERNHTPHLWRIEQIEKLIKEL